MTTASAPARKISLVTMVLGGFCQGASYNITKQAGIAGLAPIAFLFWSLVVATAMLLILAILWRRLPPLNARTLEYFFASAFLTIAAGWVINVLATPVVGASFVSLIVALIPLMTYAAATAIGLERATFQRAAGVALALAGAVLLAWNRLSVPDAPVFWILLALCMPLFLTAGNIYRTLRWPPGVSAVALALGMVAGSVIWIAGAALAAGQSLSLPSGPDALPLIAGQSIALGGQFLALLVLLKYGGVILQSLMAVTAALFGVVLAIVFLGEETPRVLLPSAALILAGVLISVFGRRT